MASPSESNESVNTRGPVDGDLSTPQPERTTLSFVGAALTSEAVLALLGGALGLWSGLDWARMMQGGTEVFLWGVGGGFVLVGIHLLLLVPGGVRNPLYRSIYEPLRAALGAPVREAPLTAVVLLALASGGAEELFFRGWLQTEMGLIGASVLFGACHVWGRDALPYGLYATGMGFLLGGLFAHTGRRLWAPILAHIVNNLLGLLALKYEWLPGVRS